MTTHRPERRGLAAVAMVALLAILGVFIVSVVVNLGLDAHLTVQRADSTRAFYAAEAGMHMAWREIDVRVDEDLDGVIGTISDDATPSTDPDLNGARVVVTASCSGADKTLTSRGRSGDAERRLEAAVE